jgi:hypothetical protein
MNDNRSPFATALFLLLGACAAVPAPDGEPRAAGWRPLFDGHSLHGFASSGFGGDGDIAVVDGALCLEMGSPLTGVTWQGEPPAGDYELEVTARRVDGTDFFCGLTFPVGEQFLTLVLGGWGGAVCGLSSIDGQDAWNNATCTSRRFETGVDYTVRLTVTPARVVATLDGAPLVAADIAGCEISLRPEVWRSRPLGICAFATRAAIRVLRWRPLPPR